MGNDVHVHGTHDHHIYINGGKLTENMHTHIYIINTHMHIHAYTHTCNTHACMCTYTDTWMHTCTHTHIQTHVDRTCCDSVYIIGATIMKHNAV